MSKTKTTFHPVVQELADMIAKNKWESKFEEAIKKANSHDIAFMTKQHVHNLPEYLNWLNAFLHWVPSEDFPGKDVYNYLCCFYFFVDQSPVKELQNAIVPHPSMPPLTPFSQWLVNYANAMGLFLDTPESLTPESEASFYASPNYNMHEYLRPRGGWKSFNQIFARNFKPGYRPVAAIADHSVITSPADSTFAGQWEIRKDSHVTVKNLHWMISELMEGSPYADRFTNGIFTHSFLNTTDYHRQHAPVAGKILEARVVHGAVYLEVNPAKTDSDEKEFDLRRKFDAPDSPGYQFAQARGVIVIDSPIGLVAVIPMGMCQVSSVVMTAEVGITLRKGEELSYFQFGGSDIVMLFENSSNVSFTAQPNVHYKMGTRIAQAFPVV